jgi:ABC-type oligopeptide transport system substrate-binding subunit
VKLTGYDKAGLRPEVQGGGTIRCTCSGWIADIPDPDNFFYPLLHGDSKDSMNASFFDDPAFNDAVKKAQSGARTSRSARRCWPRRTAGIAR